MFILDDHYISELLKDTLAEKQYPVLKNNKTSNFDYLGNLNYRDESNIIEQFKKEPNSSIYTNSEESLCWISNNLNFTNLPKIINTFKNKKNFRQFLKKLYPDFFFQEFHINDLETINIQNISTPFIIKPVAGFFSHGVYRIDNHNEWDKVFKKIKKDISKSSEYYSAEVMNLSSFIIEEVIEGREFAIDAYFDSHGNPVILDILEHPFLNQKDMGDRIYMTSKNIIEENFDRSIKFLNKIGKQLDLKNFPLHLEYRITPENKLIPIEINPLRFAGWCCTDIAFYAYGINVYEYFQEQEVPDWQEILKDKDDKTYYFTIIDIPKSIKAKNLKTFDFDSFLKHYQKPLEVRTFDPEKQTAIAYIVSETTDKNEIDKMLNINFKDFFTYEKTKKVN